MYVAYMRKTTTPLENSCVEIRIEIAAEVKEGVYLPELGMLTGMRSMETVPP